MRLAHGHRRWLTSLFVAIALACFCIGQESTAWAFQYETFIDISDDDDIWDLFNQGVIDEDTRESLLEILSRGLDLNEASRGELYTLPNLTYRDVDAILAYRQEVGGISDPVQLVAAKVIPEDKFLAIAAFLLVAEKSAGFSADGFLRYQTRWVTADNRGPPPMALQARMFTLKNLRIGLAAVATQTRIGAPVADPNRQGALVAEEAKTRFEVPKFYVQWDNGDYIVLAGSYQLGFAQRLTFDNTIQYEPNGINPDDRLFRNNRTTSKCRQSAGELAVSPCAADDDDYVTPDFRWRETLFGVAAGIKDLRLGSGSLQAYGFSSYQRKSVYQYQLVNADICDDPRVDSDACSSPDVYVKQADPLDRTSRFKFTTLPDMYAEVTAGGNVTYRFSRRNSVGVTGYGSDVRFLTRGINLDFQDWARTPFGGPFGAVGLSASYGKGWADVFAEATRSFDSMTDGGGGYASIVRGVATFGRHEIELSGRYYDQDFANPYARPISGPDQFEGLRARDEAGGRIRYTGTFAKRWNLRANADIWSRPESYDPQAFLYLRSDLKVTDQYSWGLWTEYRQSNLEADQCRQFFGNDFELSDDDGNPTTCDLNRLALTGRFRYQPIKKYWFDVLYRHVRYDGGRQDVTGTGVATIALSSDLRARGRVRWYWADIDDDESQEESVWFYADLAYRLRKRDRLRLRYDYLSYRDKRQSTLDRIPNPEHWLWFSYEAKF